RATLPTASTQSATARSGPRKRCPSTTSSSLGPRSSSDLENCHRKLVSRASRSNRESGEDAQMATESTSITFQSVATLIAACLALVASVVSLVLNLWHQRASETRHAWRQHLGEHMGPLGESLYEIVATTKIAM